ncbi:MAG TPA: hypothetical protein VGB24_11410 [Longimicrobium sp.]|jgi:hypothetical protein|uniref:hypothetical protein n=1 Tax=Longimicrobium sp. TaxID=2029185 RepID=UPI002EDA6DE9
MTMKRVLMFAALAGLAGCFPNTFRTGPVPGTDANQELALPLGETRTLDEQRFAVSFGRVMEDSRCPTGAQCVSAGNAHLALVLQERGEATRTVQLNTHTDPRVVRHEGYRVEVVGLDPLPAAGQPAPENYVVRLRITRG